MPKPETNQMRERWQDHLSHIINSFITVGKDGNAAYEWIQEDDMINMRRELQAFFQSEIFLLKKGIESDLEKESYVPDLPNGEYWTGAPVKAIDLGTAINIVRKAGE